MFSITYFLLINNLTNIMPITLERSVAKMVGKIISDGDAEFIEERNANTEDGISCTLVAFITKNIAIWYSANGCFSSSETAFIPIGVVAPLIPKRLAVRLSET
jgi:hypothetical protein